MSDQPELPFWKTVALKDMSKQQWESLCDGCARCCLQKLQDDETDEVFYTEIVCRYMDENCQCSTYQDRHVKVPTCVWLKPEDVKNFHWLPSTCAYRMVSEGKDLASWHPLVSGDKNSVHTADISIKGKGIPDDQVPEDEWQDHIIWME
jgi:uncharacterized cysteine cluster protein YcgN (CxxCxxCC family)